MVKNDVESAREGSINDNFKGKCVHPSFHLSSPCHFLFCTILKNEYYYVLKNNMSILETYQQKQLYLHFFRGFT